MLVDLLPPRASRRIAIQLCVVALGVLLLRLQSGLIERSWDDCGDLVAGQLGVIYQPLPARTALRRAQHSNQAARGRVARSRPNPRRPAHDAVDDRNFWVWVLARLAGVPLFHGAAAFAFVAFAD
jgi:hypothetical protein